MSHLNRENYMEAYAQAPLEIQELATSAETSRKLGVIYARQHMNDKAFDISAVIGYTLVGLIPIKNFIGALQEEAGLDTENAKHIAYDIRSQIFAPVAEQLAELQPRDQAAAAPFQSQPKETPPIIQHDKPIPEDNIVDLSNKLR